MILSGLLSGFSADFESDDNIMQHTLLRRSNTLSPLIHNSGIKCNQNVDFSSSVEGMLNAP
jgi:hypothetical protein